MILTVVVCAVMVILIVVFTQRAPVATTEPVAVEPAETDESDAIDPPVHATSTLSRITVKVNQVEPVPDEESLVDAPGSAFVRPAKFVDRRLVDERQPGWKATRKFIADWAMSDPRGAAEWVAAHVPAGGDRAYALREALSRWAAYDPAGALKWAKTLAAGAGRDSALRAVFQTWAAMDPAAAAAGLAKTGDFATKELAVGMVAFYWAKKDLAAAIAWAWGLPAGPGKTTAMANILRQVNANNRAAGRQVEEIGTVASGPANPTAYDSAIRTLTFLLQAQNPGITPEAVAALIPGGFGASPALLVRIADWAKKDAISASTWAAQVAGDRERQQALATVTSATGQEKTDPPAAAATPAVVATTGGQPASPEGSTGTKGQPATAADILAQDRSVAINLAEQLPDGPMRDGVIGTLAIEWGKEDPQAAVAWASEQLGANFVGDSTVRAIVWDWTARDPAAAEAWAMTLQEPTRQEQAIASIALSLVKTDIAAAARVAETMLPGERKFSTVSNIAFQWGRMDLGGATAWAAGLGTESGGDYALVQVAALKAVTGLDGALEWAQTLAAGSARDSALGGIAYFAAGLDVAQAQTIARSLPEGPGREKAIPAIEASLVRTNPDNAAAWLSTLPQGRSTDLARVMFADMTVAARPAEACAQALLVQDANLRLSLLDRSIGSWLGIDPAAASAWVNQSTLTVAEKQYLMNR